jgi:NitT/TauT family transport system permease protein/putative hydroxymethylpyrimidine transport system permease protein
MRAALLALALLGGWELYAQLGSVDDFLLPAPTEIATAAWQDRSLLWDNFTVTAREMGLGLLCALGLALTCALALHLSPTARRAVYPLLVASQTVPIPIVAPLLVAWFGFDLVPKLAIVALVCFFPIVVPVLDGLDGVAADQRKLMRTLGASRWQLLRHVEAPSALPGLFTGAKLSVAIAAIAAILAEQAGSSAGIGYLIVQAIPQLETARAWAAVVVLSLFSIALFGALALAERRLVPWARPSRGTPT